MINIKNILKTSLIFLFACNSQHEIKTFTFSDEKLMGKIETITTVSYEAIETGGTLVPGNKKGNSYRLEFINDTILEQTIFDLSEEPTDKSRYIFNNKNSLLKRYIFCLKDEGQLSYEGIYDAHNNKIQEKIYNYGKELSMEAFFDYNSTNQIVKGIAQSYSHIPSGYWKYQHDKSGNVISEDYFTKSENFLRNSNKKEYDSQDRLKKNISFNNHRGETTTYFFRYDEKDNVIEKKTIHPNSITTETFSYKFDQKDNWVEKHIFLNGKPSEYVVRTIIYNEEI